MSAVWECVLCVDCRLVANGHIDCGLCSCPIVCSGVVCYCVSLSPHSRPVVIGIAAKCLPFGLECQVIVCPVLIPRNLSRDLWHSSLIGIIIAYHKQ